MYRTSRPVGPVLSNAEGGNEGRLSAFKPKELVLLTAAFFLGCWPLLLYNLETSGTFRSITDNAQTSFYGVDNYAFGPNLLERLGQFVVLLNGSHLWYLGKVFHNPAGPIIFVLVFSAVLIASALTTRTKKGIQTSGLVKVALFPFLVIGLVILASIQTVSALWITHFALLMPWPAIALSVGGWFVIRQISYLWPTRVKGPVVMALAMVITATLIITNLATAVRYHLSLAESGGLSTHSDAIYDLSQWLVEQAKTAPEPRPVIAMDWGLTAPIIYLTGGQVAPVEVFGYAWTPDVALESRLTRFIDDPATVYLWRAPDEVIFDRSPEFKAFYRPLALEETIEAAFYERSGRPILGITRLVECGTSGIESPEPADHCP
ncbi:MAG: hypothetical protein R3264_09275 [Anaerolineae bacterium]|nr:hypothetical protein [Anaerolineae bacterium]